MPERTGKNGQDAGNSADATAVAELVERLRVEVARSGLAGSPGDGRIAARSLAELYWPVTFDRPVEHRPGLRGKALRPVKQVLRRLMRWYVEPVAEEQRAFNSATLKLVDALSEALDSLAASSGGGERLVAELEERLLRLERARQGGASTIAAQPRAAAMPDYFAFESRMRGTAAEIRDRQRPYVEGFREAAPVLDLGCGRGEFLALLREAGVEARGVDADADMVAFARGEGLEVEQADVVEALERAPDGSLGGIFAAQLVEHLPPPLLLRMLELAARKLRAGGVLVVETINPLSPLALRNYFADLTHAQPLVPETLELLVRQAGFRELETRFLNPPDDRLREPDDPLIAANVRRLNDLLFGPLDYAVLART